MIVPHICVINTSLWDVLLWAKMVQAPCFVENVATVRVNCLSEMSCVWFNAQTVPLKPPLSVYNEDRAKSAAKIHILVDTTCALYIRSLTGLCRNCY